LSERPEDLHEVSPHRGQLVLYSTRDYADDVATYQSQRLHSFEAFGDGGGVRVDDRPQVVESSRALLDQRPEQLKSMLLTEEPKRPFEIAVGGRPSRSRFRRLLCPSGHGSMAV